MKKAAFLPRTAEATLKRLATSFPVIGITGPRQAGKTTLARHEFAEKPYISLEDPDQLDFAQTDPRRFLGQFKRGAVLDEVQRCPQLFSYLQRIVDEAQQMGQFVLTGSQQFGFREKITQTLAGRIGLIHLLPFSASELKASGLVPESLDNVLYKGFYPPLYDRHIQPNDWYAAYVQTYIERDVQQLIKVKDLNAFRTFLRLCAGRAGQIVNLSGIGNDCGVSHNTVREWLSVLEASYIVFQLQPHFNNFSKRMIKSPKLYFYDTGLLVWLLGIKQAEHIAMHAMRGALFENFIIGELLKHQYAQGEPSSLYFWRDNNGLEIDVIIDQGDELIPVEIKAGQTINKDFFKNLKKWRALAGDKANQAYLIYGGDQVQDRSDANVLPWRHLEKLYQY
ncbi:MAG: ATP-binding protein [Pseudomonadales bacterium]